MPEMASDAASRQTGTALPMSCMQPHACLATLCWHIDTLCARRDPVSLLLLPRADPPQGYGGYGQQGPPQYGQNYGPAPQYQQPAQQPQKDHSCLMGCLAAMCVCCALDAIF